MSRFFMPALKNPKTFYVASFVIVCGALLLSLFIPPVLNMDVWDGLDTLIAHQYHNAPLNHKLWINPDDISQTLFEYMGWFAPAQYLIPWAIHKLTCITLGKAAVLSYFLAWLTGVPGFVCLFRKFQINPLITAISVFIFSVQYFTLMPYFTLDSADFYLFAFLPWAALFFMKTLHPVLLFLAVTALVIIAFFLKFSALILIIPLPVMPYLYRFFIKKEISFAKMAMSVITAATAYLLAFITIKQLFLDKGQNVSQLRNFGTYWSDFIFPFAAHIAGMFSLDNTIDFIYNDSMHTKHLGFKVARSLLPVYAGLFLLYWLVQWHSLRHTKLQTFYSFYVLLYPIMIAPFFMILYFFNTGTDNTTRLYFFGAFLLTPYLLSLVFNQRVFLVLFLIFFVLNIYFQYHKLYDIKRGVLNGYYVTGTQGFAYDHLSGDREVLTLLKKLDQSATGNELLVLPAMGLSLELKKIKYIVFHEKWHLDMQLGWYPDLFGKTGTLYVLSNKAYCNHAIPLYLEKFRSYEKAIVADSTSAHYLYVLM